MSITGRVIAIIVAALFAVMVVWQATEAQAAWSQGELNRLEKATYNYLDDLCDELEFQYVPGVPPKYWPRVYECHDVRAVCDAGSPPIHPSVAVCTGSFQLWPTVGGSPYPYKTCDISLYFQRRIVNGRVRYRLLHFQHLDCREGVWV